MLLCCTALVSCTHMSASEQYQLHRLQKQGITIDHPKSNWKKPANPWLAGALNILPGMGNLYLGVGNGARSSQLVYGVANILTWPYSIIWGVPSAVHDAHTINEIDLVYYYADKKQDQQNFYDTYQDTYQPVQQNVGQDVYYPGNGYYYNGYYGQNDYDGRGGSYSDSSCNGNCGGSYNNNRNQNNSGYYNQNNGGYYDSYDHSSDGRNTYNSNFYNNSSYNVMPYNGNSYTEEYFDRQEEDSHKYDWERYYYR